MLQQIIATIVIAFFIFRLYWQKKRGDIAINEYWFWLFFWLLAFLAVVFIKKIDQLVASLGFSGSGIDVLLYIGIIILFYTIFRLRLKIERIERNITKLVRKISLDK